MQILTENLKFLLSEVENQINLTKEILADSTQKDNFEKIESKDDYIDNLKTVLENTCFSRIHGQKHYDEKTINKIRTAHVIAVNLERIADFCVNIANQTKYLSDPFFIHHFKYLEMIEEIEDTLSKIFPAFEKANMAQALDICRSEFNLDMMYEKNFRQIMSELKTGQNMENLITVIFIFRYLERIGDSLLNIGEALLFAITGDKIKIRQFDALQQTLTESGFKGDILDINWHPIWGSRSGCHISKIDYKEGSQSSRSHSIFKEGVTYKIKKEKETIEKWEKLMPGIVPRIFGFNEKPDTSSMLIEFLPGCTLEEVILNESEPTFEEAFLMLQEVLAEIWDKTAVAGNFKIDYMEQLKSRLPSIFSIQPKFIRNIIQVGDTKIQSSKE
ncbi:MAG: phosphate uptake regulator PhoU [Desulfobacterales bacterium]|nr:phosphate uptake regulator PhoU [Desulfobacterales bacterium]